jgi:hypothetical protein
MARITAAGSARSSSIPSSARTSGESGMVFWLRAKTPPPGLSFAES